MYKSNINLNLYKSFYDVAKYGSISKAAEASYTSQPAVSKAIKKLESELNIDLFIRKTNGVELTEKGKELLYYVEKSYNDLITAERVMIETENLTRGKLSIGMPTNIGTFFLFDKLVDFHKKYPNIEITMVSGRTHQLMEALVSHELDFVIDTAPVDLDNYPDYTSQKLFDVNYCFAVKKNSKLIDYKNIKSIKDFKSNPLILPIPGTANRNGIDNVFNNYGIKNINAISIHTSELILLFTKNDLGIGYLMEDIIKDDKDVEKINVKEKLPSVDILLVYNKNLLTTAPKKFIKDYMNINID